MCLRFLYTLYSTIYFIVRTIYVLYMGTSLQATDVTKARTVYCIPHPSFGPRPLTNQI